MMGGRSSFLQAVFDISQVAKTDRSQIKSYVWNKRFMMLKEAFAQSIFVSDIARGGRRDNGRTRSEVRSEAVVNLELFSL
jgi:hypothetical protein